MEVDEHIWNKIMSYNRSKEAEIIHKVARHRSLELLKKPSSPANFHDDVAWSIWQKLCIEHYQSWHHFRNCTMTIYREQFLPCGHKKIGFGGCPNCAYKSRSYEEKHDREKIKWHNKHRYDRRTGTTVVLGQVYRVGLTFDRSDERGPSLFDRL